jgi:hypothetical protein
VEFSIQKDFRMSAIVHLASSTLLPQLNQHHGRFRFDAQKPGYLFAD